MISRMRSHPVVRLEQFFKEVLLLLDFTFNRSAAAAATKMLAKFVVIYVAEGRINHRMIVSRGWVQLCQVCENDKTLSL